MKLIGTVEHIIYKNSENGYTVLTLFARGRTVTVSGKFPIIGKGEELELENEWVKPCMGLLQATPYDFLKWDNIQPGMW